MDKNNLSYARNVGGRPTTPILLVKCNWWECRQFLKSIDAKVEDNLFAIIDCNGPINQLQSFLSFCSLKVLLEFGEEFPFKILNKELKSLVLNFK